MNRFIQITDLHIGNEEEFPLGVNLRQNFTNILNLALEYKPDYFFFTGDFCLKGPRKETYLWLKPIMGEAKIPYFVIRGNHDDDLHFYNVFGLNKDVRNGKLYYEKIIDDCQFIFLDSADGTIDEEQLIWMNTKLDKHPGRTIIMIHHPPCLAGLPHMDEKHHLKNWESFQSILKNKSKFYNIFCGHYHTERTLNFSNFNVFITPSLYIQIDDKTSDFAVEHYNPAFRIIDVDKNQLLTRVIYGNPSRF